MGAPPSLPVKKVLLILTSTGASESVISLFSHTNSDVYYCLLPKTWDRSKTYKVTHFLVQLFRHKFYHYVKGDKEISAFTY